MAALEALKQEMRSTADVGEREGNRLKESFERAIGALETVGLYMGIREAIDVMKELVGGSLELGEALGDASRQTGLAVETLSVLHYTAGVTGGSFEAMTGALSKMNVTIAKAADGNSKAAAFMSSLGLNAKDLAGRTDGAEVAFGRFLKTLAATESSSRRNELAFAMLGKASASQIPALLDMAENWDVLKQKASQAGQLMSAETAAQLEDTNHRLKDLKMRAEGAGLAFTEGLNPSLNEMFRILTGGQSSADAFTAWGDIVGRTMAHVAATVYSTASELERLFALAEGGKLTAIGRRDWQSADDDQQKSIDLEKIATGKSPLKPDKPFLPEPKGGPGRGGFEGTTTAGKAKSGNAIVEAAKDLAREQAKAEADLVKYRGQAELAELDARHKDLLDSDLEYYNAKFRVQNEAYAAEEKALDTQTQTLQETLKKQHSDASRGLLKRGKDGNSAEELKTQRELVQIGRERSQLDSKRRSTESAYNAEVNTSNMAAELNGLRAAAALERERNDGITAQIALIQKEHELEARKAVLAGGTEQDAAAIRSAGDVATKKLQAQEVQEGINRAESEHRRTLEEVNDAVQKADMSKRTAAQKTKEANADLLKQLEQERDAYRELAESVGDPTMLEHVKDLQTEIDNLGRTDHRGTFGKEVIDGMEQMTDSLAEQAALGKQSFSEMAASILHDAERLAIKLAEEKFLAPLFESALGGVGGGAPTGSGGGFGSFISGLFGASGEHHASGGIGSDGPQLVGDAGGHGEIWTPPTRGGSYTTSAVLKRLAEGGGSAGRQPSVTTNVINQSSTPVAASTSSNYDSQLREMVTHVFLTDLHEGGSIAQAIPR